MNSSLQSRLFAARAVRTIRRQEELARSIRPLPDLPEQRCADPVPAALLSVDSA